MKINFEKLEKDDLSLGLSVLEMSADYEDDFVFKTKLSKSIDDRLKEKLQQKENLESIRSVKEENNSKRDEEIDDGSILGETILKYDQKIFDEGKLFCCGFFEEGTNNMKGWFLIAIRIEGNGIYVIKSMKSNTRAENFWEITGEVEFSFLEASPISIKFKDGKVSDYNEEKEFLIRKHLWKRFKTLLRLRNDFKSLLDEGLREEIKLEDNKRFIKMIKNFDVKQETAEEEPNDPDENSNEKDPNDPVKKHKQEELLVVDFDLSIYKGQLYGKFSQRIRHGFGYYISGDRKLFYAGWWEMGVMKGKHFICYLERDKSGGEKLKVLKQEDPNKILQLNKFNSKIYLHVEIKGESVVGFKNNDKEEIKHTFVYKGLSLNMSPHGHGSVTYFDENGKPIGGYKGNFKFGKREGLGKLFHDMKHLVVKYEGDWKDDRPHGSGIEYAANGDVVFAGKFKDGMPQRCIKSGSMFY